MSDNNDLIIFEEDQKVIEISLEVLKRTIPLTGPGGKMPNNRPKQHYEVFEKILEMAKAKNLETSLDPIFIHKNHTDRVSEVYAAKHNIPSVEYPEGNFVKMCVGRIHIGGKFDNEEDNVSIGISYSPAGIDICVGQHVKACRNMTIFGGKFLTNFGSDKLPYEHMLEQLEEWMNELPEIMEFNHAIVDAMREIVLDQKTGVRQLYGALIEAAIKMNYLNGPRAPLNDTQVTEFIKRSIPEVRDSEPEGINLYTLYNIGTNILTHQTALNNRWETVRIFGDFLIENYDI